MLGKLNGDLAFDLANTLLNFYGNNPDSNPYSDECNKHHYFDTDELSLNNTIKSSPFLLSVNIQSLKSKFNALDFLTADLIKNNVNLSLIALQEIWQVEHPELFEIKGFNFYHSQRTKFKGGVVGFYVNSELSSKINLNLSIFHEKIFECLTVEVVINNKKHFISNIYRSPSLVADNVNSFLDKFEELLSKLDKSDCPYILLLDSHINLLKLPSCNLS